MVAEVGYIVNWVIHKIGVRSGMIIKLCDTQNWSQKWDEY